MHMKVIKYAWVVLQLFNGKTEVVLLKLIYNYAEASEICLIKITYK